MDKGKKRLLKWVLGAGVMLLIMGLGANGVLAAAAGEEQGLVDKARITFEGFMTDPDMQWFRDNMHQAKALMIVPQLLKGAFFVGGAGGSGVLVVRDEKTGDWSQPAFYTIGSASFGLQFGGEASEVVMMVRTQKAVDSFLSSSFKLGGEVKVSAGPKGAGATSDVLTDIISFARSKGAFLGMSLEGAVIDVKEDYNQAYYGKPVRPTDILVKQDVRNPGADGLRAALKKGYR